MIDYHCVGEPVHCPKDAQQRPISQQIFTYNALGGITSIRTVLAGDSTAQLNTYYYENTQDPTQLTRVVQTNPASEIRFQYDAAGRLIRDAAGRIIRYDAQGRVLQLLSADGNGTVLRTYTYNAEHVIAQEKAGNTTRTLFYQDGNLVNEQIESPGQPSQQIHYLRWGHCV